MISYHDLLAYWRCPRAFALHRLGWEAPAQPQEMTRGQMTHAAITGHLLGLPIGAVLDMEVAKARGLAAQKLQGEDLNRAVARIEAARAEAQPLAARYVAVYAQDYEVVELAPEWYWPSGLAVAHPDALARYHGSLGIVDWKTAGHPDALAYHISGQADWYAWLYGELHPRQEGIGLVLYEVITPEAVLRLEQPPQLRRGLYLATQMDRLHKEEGDWCLANPSYRFDCPKCDYIQPCWLMDTEGDYQHWLARNMVNTLDVKEVKQ